ncbi:hypothetical protein, variant [Aphanomyces astaci]|uniref:Nuclear factor related to kappa-B-binding protein second winged helix domain-containing protein n=1 Tax=Aphanomyces astaci TaxID=112090 RepID=W4GES1_APHAT|nr:hypothetical protein, variant [Aphanomyces astaci]ETV78160.1 hypothetical protein, variant [Aphanomyces astaci]|eukprot:XP_009832497.1 hypothetical protein, variant [Aphanomyces astaci]
MAGDTTDGAAHPPPLHVDLSKPFQARVPKLVSVHPPSINSTTSEPSLSGDDFPVNLLALLPPDAWDRLSFEEQQALLPDLPPLDGWWDLSGDDATAENLRQLFRGGNFNFGNPLMSFYFPSESRTRARAAARAAFDARKRVFTKQLLQSIIQNRSQCLKQVLPADELALNPELDISVIPPCKAAVDDVDHSFFLAIRLALTASGHGVAVDAVAAYVETHAPRTIPPISERPQHMQVIHYVHSALLFLSRPTTSDPPSPHQDDLSWSFPFVNHDVTTNTFTWQLEGGDKTETVQRLLLLERLFRSPFDLVDPSMRPVQCALELARKRHPDLVALSTPPLKKQLKVTGAGDDAFHAADPPPIAPPSLVLKRAHLPLHRQYPLLRDAFQPQELQRYQHPHQPFIYFDGDSGFQTLVGPCFPPLQSDRVASNVLLPDVAPQVTVLNVVRDAVARLPCQCGTRADVLALLRMSMYVRRCHRGMSRRH